MVDFIKKYWCQLTLAVLVLTLLITNYKPGTYLSGWDNIQTDLYPWLGVKRSLHAVWQEYQSFGLLSGLAHGSDLIRALIIWLISFWLPRNLIRYLFHHTVLLLGGLGMFYLLRFLKLSAGISLVSSFFYILNFGTVEIFSLPLESFSIFFAALPWLIYGALNYLTNPGKKSLVFFFLINLLATPGYYIQTMFLVYFFVLSLTSLVYLGKNRQSWRKILRNLAFIYILTFLINSFWLLPQLYFLKTSIASVLNAKTTTYSNSTVLNQNIGRGNLIDFFSLKGFYYDLNDRHNLPLFLPWQLFFKNELIIFLQILIAITIVIGILAGKNKYKNIFLALLFLNATALLLNTPGFSQINKLLRQNSVINQIFRSPFTKFIIPHSLTFSFFLALGVDHIKNRFNNRLMVFSALSIIIIVSLPAFQGNFFAAEMKTPIPKEYFQLFNFFRDQDKNKRIALFPEYTFWGWFIHRWGYNGSGFLWYGIEQPIVSRTFDVWSRESENYYWEVYTALIRNDTQLLDSVLNKYDISYLVLDKSVQPIATSYRALQLDQIKKAFSSDPKIRKLKTFNFIEIYQFTPNQDKSFITGETSLPNIYPKVSKINQDIAYEKYQTYQTDYNQAADIYYPFLDLQSFAVDGNKHWSISKISHLITLKSVVSFPPLNSSQLSNQYHLNIGSQKQSYLFVKNDEEFSYQLPIKTVLDQDYLKVSFPQLRLQPSTITDFLPCESHKGIIKKVETDKGLLLSASKGGIGCIGYVYNYLPQQYSYLLEIKTQNIQGENLSFYVLDHTRKQAVIQDDLTDGVNYYIIPKIFKYGIGLSVNLTNRSYRNIASKNIINNLSLNVFPEDLVKHINFQKNTYHHSPKTSIQIDGVKKHYWLYLVTYPAENSKENNLILLQAFHPGWKGYTVSNSRSLSFINTYFPFLFGKELKNHLLINNWANGWHINNETMKQLKNKSIVIIFLPQYLEFIGLALLLISLIAVLSLSDKPSKN